MKCPGSSFVAITFKRPIRTPALALLLLLPALSARADDDDAPAGVLPPEESFIRTARAARRTGPINLDGRMDEAAWQQAPLNETFTQSGPDEGKPASVATRFRVLWDDENLYFGAECDDPLPPTQTLSRRDRFVEGDSVQFDLDTTFDRRTAYHFQVYAAGQQLDGIHYNDTSMTTDWDGAWDSRVARTDKGWSVEMRIPLRLMRIPDGAHQFGFNVYRLLSRRKEEDQWRYRPSGRPGDMSRLGILEGIDGLRPVRALELRPYLGARFIHNNPAPSNAVPHGELGGCSSIGFERHSLGEGCAGLDLRYNLASDLALVGTINPDFGQVEADSRVLNLSTFETFFPEKRPFFLEGLDLFKPALRVDFGGPYGGDAYQIFYSRRIGRGAPDFSLADGQTSVYQRPSVPVATAAKVSGTLGAFSVGLLTALEPRLTAQVREASGLVDELRTAEARSTSSLRARAPLGDVGLVGVMGTAVDPIFTDNALGLERRHAHVGEADLTLFTPDRAWDFTIQGAGSLITGRDPGVLRDGTPVSPTSSGWAGSARLAYQTEHTRFAVNGDRLTPTFTVNDLGFMQRANLTRAMGYFALRDPHPNSWRQRVDLLFGAREVRDAAFENLLERDALLELNLTDKAFWFYNVGVIGQAPFLDDRELADGTPLERQRSLAAYGYAQTDSRKPLQLQFSYTYVRSYPLFERQNQLEGTLVFRPLPQLEGSFGVSYNEQAGTIRQIRAATALPGSGADVTALLDRAAALRQTRLYLLAEQQARSVSATLRATYAFTPYLTLQTYAQLFTAGIAYGNPLRAVVGPGKRVVTLAELSPALPEDRAPDADDRQIGLNVNLILRWEWRTGSTFYLVYAHQSSNELTPLVRGLSFSGELNSFGQAGVTHGDTILLKLDLLSALHGI